MRSVLRTGGRTAVLVFALTLAISGALMADLANPYVSYPKYVSSGNTIYQDELTATVTYANGLYHYLYVLDFAQGYNGGSLTEFSVGNLQNYYFSNAGNDWGFANPVWGVTSSNSVWWKSASVPVGSTVSFWFDSPNPYTEVNVTLKATRLTNSGKTLGMIPEPGSIVTLVTGILGVGGFALRKRMIR